MKAFPKQKSGETADIALLLEGTYPFVRGGVSAWVHQIIRGMPEFTFSIAFLGGAREHYQEPKYELPPNVIHVECHYLMESWVTMMPSAHHGNSKAFLRIANLHDYFRDPHVGLSPDLFQRTIISLGTKRGILRKSFLYSEEAWRRICEDYTRFCTEPSFVNYFWTVRTMHAPLFTLAEIARKFPRARMFHAVSTGYAGMLGVLLRHLRGGTYLLSEHGIYTKERRIDLANADWIQENRISFGGGLEVRVSYIRRLWIQFFEGLGRLTYEAADRIIALFEGNRQRQILDGAPAEKTSVIPNGIDLERLSRLRPRRPQEIPMVLGLIGRVVPIKDIRTFIRAMRSVCSSLAEAEGWIIGPEDEDPDYARECRDLVESLGLKERVKFLGFQKIDDILPKLGLLLLTSISEGLPLVLIEGFAAGVPAVTTDVGSCRELIEGQTAADRELGASGSVVPIADPEAVAQASLTLLTDPEKWHSAQRAGVERVERFYKQSQMFAAYRALYQELLEVSSGRNRL